MSPLVSVIVPTYSRPINLIRAIESVLSQSYKHIEIIVVDDNGIGSDHQIETEKSLSEYIHKCAITYIKHSVNKNGSAARNTGFSHSKGKYICFLDDDDIFSKDKIQSQIETLEHNCDYNACYCDTVIVRKDGSKLHTHNPDNVSDVGLILSGKCYFNTSTVVFRRSCIEALDGFDEKFRRHQDYELYVRFFRNWKMIKAHNAQVIKFETVNEVAINPHKSIESLDYFLNHFHDDIERMPLKNEIYKYQYNTCVVRYITCGKYREAYRVYRSLLKWGTPDLYSHLKYIYHLLSRLKLYR